MDLLLHVGYPKTGTTTLQKQHFTALPGFLGSPAVLGYGGRAGLLKPLAKAAYGARRVDLDAWRTRLLGLFGDQPPERILISSEGLIRWDVGWNTRAKADPVTGGRTSRRDRGIRTGPHPLAGFLRDHVGPAWQDLGSVRVLITLRNQSDWFASHYAENSYCIVGASQSDFERQVRRLLGSGDAFLDYAEVVASFRNAVGEDRVVVLLLEDMADDGYWEALSQFVGARIGVERMAEERVNQRSTSAGWQLRDYDRRISPLRHAISGWAKGTGPERLPTMGGFRNPAGLEWLQAGRRGGSLLMPDDLRTAVRSRFQDSNARLGRMLGRDLAPLGY